MGELCVILQWGSECFAGHSFKFQKRSQLFIGVHDKTLSVVAMCVDNPDCSPFGSIAETQPKLQPALLRLSAMISQYFIGQLHRKLQANGQTHSSA